MNEALITFLPLLVIFGAVYYMLVVVGKRSNGLDQQYYQRYWSTIEKTASDGTSGMKLAIIDADKLLDHALKARKFNGTTMGERLVSAQGAIKKYQNVWDAHKLRNKLVHEAEVSPKKSDVTFAMSAFKSALKDLGAL